MGLGLNEVRPEFLPRPFPSVEFSSDTASYEQRDNLFESNTPTPDSRGREDEDGNRNWIRASERAGMKQTNPMDVSPLGGGWLLGVTHTISHPSVSMRALVSVCRCSLIRLFKLYRKNPKLCHTPPPSLS
ncbi:hypothetical protein Dimus_008928 [Dionaea muscipula]